MHLNRRTLAGISGALVFTLTLGLSSVAAEDGNTVIGDGFQIQLSAGVNAAVNGLGDNTSAGATDAMDDTVGIVDQENEQVGQGVPEEEVSEED